MGPGGEAPRHPYPSRMRRFIALALAAVFVATACTAVAPPSASQTKQPDIKRSKLDAAYSGLTDDDVFAPTSKEVLTAALQAMKDEVQKAGGRADIVSIPDFTDKSEPNNDDFKKFAEAASKLASANALVPGDRLADAALLAMAKVKPDCHTQDVKRTSAVPSGVSAAPVETGGQAQYQLPVAVVINGRSASMSEMFALAFKETKRGMLFGTKTIGCLGSTNILNLIDGSIFQYTVSEFVGGVTNAAYNNIGVMP